MHRTNAVLEPSFARTVLPPGRPSVCANPCSPRPLWVGGLLLALLVSGLAQAQPVAPPPGASPPAPSVIVTAGGSELRSMPTGKRIRTVNIADPRFVNVVAGRQPNQVYIVGQAPGATTVTLTDEDGKTDRFEVVVVAFDIQQLRNVLRQAVPTASVVPIPAGNNAVIMAGTVDRAEDIPAVLQSAQALVGGLQLINTLRVGGVQQVQLDVTVAQVSRSELRSMAFNFLGSDGNFFLGSTVGQAVANPAIIGRGSTFLTTQGIVAGSPGAPNGLPTNLLVGFLDPNSGFLGFLQALRTEGLLKLLAEPRLVSLSGRQASFLSGGEQAIPVPAGLGQVGVQFEEFGTRLNFIPVVLGNGKIHLEVEPEVSFLDPASGTNIQGTVVPGRATQRARTTVEIESGQTLVIGGLIQHTVNASTIKTPILGDLPFIGAAFNSKVFNEIESELLILVTPYLVDPIDCAQYPKCLPGQETRSPDDFELFLEGILEAPRGAREVCPDGHYRPAFKNGPTAAIYPCAGNAGYGGGCGAGGCGAGGCGAVLSARPAHRPAASGGTVPSVPRTVSYREEVVSPSLASPASLPPALTGSGGPKQP
jgi:pilus assembly protein CpaC